MIISEKQIMRLMSKCKDYMVILSLSSQESSESQYNQIKNLFDEITNQQSEELKAID